MNFCCSCVKTDNVFRFMSSGAYRNQEIGISSILPNELVIFRLYVPLKYSFSPKSLRTPSLFTLIRQIILFSVFFFLFSSPKLYFVIHDALPVFERTFKSNPQEGSIHIWWTILPFIIPFKVSFYDRPFFQNTIGFFFNWYEYYAFLSPVPFLLFIPVIKKMKKDPVFFFLFSFFCTGLLYISLAYPYSPFYWLFEFIPQLSILRVPQRMYLPLSSVIILLFCLAAQNWKNKTILYIILLSSLTWTGIASLDALKFGFEQPRTKEQALVKWLRNYDKGKYFVYDALCCNQRFLVEERIPILNFYAGWIPKGTPSFSKTYLPTYVLSKHTDDFSLYGYEKIYQTDAGSIWKTNTPTIFPADSLRF